MERRGAAEVVAVDIEDPEALDWPTALRHKTVKTIDETKGDRFELVRRTLGSSVDRRLSSVYRLDPDELGQFDFVFCGDMLVHLKDPASMVERIRAVCRGVAVLTNPVKEHFPYRRRPLAQFDGIDEFEWWVPNRAALERLVRAAGFPKGQTGPEFALAATGGGKWKGRRRWVRGESAAWRPHRTGWLRSTRAQRGEWIVRPRSRSWCPPSGARASSLRCSPRWRRRP